ncbi:21910_t:CDS:2 [Rhizophagus irregularis]|nr:21910_t:CDS:2 [Rhizophagus irregularis]
MSLNFFGSKKAEMQGKFHKEQEFPYAPVNAGETKAQLEEKNPELEVSERTICRELKNLWFCIHSFQEGFSFDTKSSNTIDTSIIW